MASDDKDQSPGRKANAARTPPDANRGAGTPQAYPSVRKDDGVEAGGPPKNPEPRQGAGDGSARGER